MTDFQNVGKSEGKIPLGLVERSCVHDTELLGSIKDG